MKKSFTLALLSGLFSLGWSSSSAQILQGTTTVSGSNNMTITVTVNTNTNLVDINMTGTNGTWFGYGFGGSSMSGTYTIITSGTGALNERQLGNHTSGSSLSSSLTTNSNTTSGGVRTVNVTRSRTGATGSHYTFPSTAGSISMIWAKGSSSSLSQHASNSRGSAILTLQNICNIAPTNLPTIDLCQGDSAQVFGQWVNTAGTYRDTITTSVGCDSIVVQTVNLNASPVNNLPFITLCPGETASVFGQTVTEAGVFYDTATSALGCDSIIVQEVLQDSVDIQVVYLSSATLDASGSNGTSYEWIDCADSSSTGITTSTFTATAIGDYAVVVSNGNCTDTSECYSITIGLEESEYNLGNVLPNPFQDELHLENIHAQSEWAIYNITGQEIVRGIGSDETIRLQTREWPAGFYTVTIFNGHQTETHKLIKR